ncbi:MAG: SDR family oxidoreductase [Eubacteriales bacterium]
MFSLQGKNAIITGGNKNLGLGITEGLCKQGANVVILASSDSVHTAAAELTAKGYQVKGIQVDLSEKTAIENAFSQAMEHLGGTLDILVNNAGIIRRNKCEDFTFEDWNDVININLTSVFLLCQLGGRVMISQGKGKIINIASMLSFFGGQTVPSYAASKAGVAQLTKALSNEWASKGINVNAIAPGYMATDMTSALSSDKERNAQILERIPAGRWGKPEDMQGLAIFLASEASDYICGAVIPIDGGYLAK